MRIQHNIMAMNAYRNYTNNTSALAKNLEKLSSGYKINRAGDDAAGLAISEKMRAQITGLKTAQKNAKDGISLVQTAEGALTEVHDMLNRMVDLADQSANGTYDNETDRANLQKEITQLKSEIDRIADASNFNGIKLLDGSLGGGTAGGAAGVPAYEGDGLGALTDVAATAGASTVKTTAATADWTPDTDYTFTFALSDGTTSDITLHLSADGKRFTYNGEDVSGADLATAKKATAGELSKALAAAVNKSSLKSTFTADGTTTAGDLVLTNKTKGTGQPSILAMKGPDGAGTGTGNVAGAVTDGVDAYQKGGVVSDKVFTVGGQKFMFATTDDIAAAADADVNVVKIAGANATNAEMTTMANIIKQKTGYAPTVNGTDFEWKADTTAGKAGKGLTLQIGEDSNSYNQLTVSVGDMHTAALGISGINIGTQAGAQAAVDVIKKAINSVSSTRGDLGATQNRLEHTINNLSVMQENIQDAEANIRDVDVAEEMMSYTKNNILVQSAQAMLAQANQIPQGVLQLLQ